MATGDLRGCLRKLEFHLRSLKYPKEADYAGLAKGDPSAFLPIVSYAFVSYSSCVAEHLVEFGAELAGKNDHRFVESVYKVLRDLFNYKPLLTKEQFLQFGFSERKISILCDIIGFVTEKHRELCKTNKPKRKPHLPSSNPRSVPEGPALEPDFVTSTALPERPPKKPLVERHVGFSLPARPRTSSDESASGEPDGEEEEEEEEEADEGSEAEVISARFTAGPADPAVEQRLQALELQLQECQRKLGMLQVLKGRLEHLERDMAGKIVIDRQDWENLESRVLLLETRLALTPVQKPSSLLSGTANHEGADAASQEPTETSAETPEGLPAGGAGASPHAAAINPRVLTAVPKENITERLERIARLMEDTTSLLKSGEPSM
ncbi:centrosomal protein of 44 kDa [Megalops cyprinoides]|uniref:centrosomal protein of 44 kDa n=1 Tax=Megalops cyprinoides TaxID=118141 RepID=UPI001863F1BA|nr:centrosomal protein of 44 kDa [Megalops cyprinoides]